MEEKNFLDVHDVSNFLGVSVPKSYKIIQQLNKELKAKGYITIAGRISRAYFMQKTVGFAQ